MVKSFGFLDRFFAPDDHHQLTKMERQWGTLADTTITMMRHINAPPPIGGSLCALPLTLATSYPPILPQERWWRPVHLVTTDEYSHAIVHCSTLHMYSLLILIRDFPSEGRTTWVRRYCNLTRGLMRTVLPVPPGTYMYAQLI
jgi:hypothetical protein